MKLPSWMKSEFEKGTCNYCKKSLTEKGVLSHGIKEDRSRTKGKIKYSHFYDYKCPKCRNRYIFSFPTSWKEFVNDMMNVASMEVSSNEEKTRKSKKKSLISDEEFEAVKRELDQCDDLKDFFRKIGIEDLGPDMDKDDED